MPSSDNPLDSEYIVSAENDDARSSSVYSDKQLVFAVIIKFLVDHLLVFLSLRGVLREIEKHK